MTDPITCNPAEVAEAVDVLSSKYAYLSFPLKDHIPIDGLRSLKQHLERFSSHEIATMWCDASRRRIWSNLIYPIFLPSSLREAGYWSANELMFALETLVRWCDYENVTIGEYTGRMCNRSMCLDVDLILKKVRWAHLDRYEDAQRQSNSDWPTV